MKSFTEDIEHKLDKMYKGGASGKFGVNNLISDDQSEQNDDIKDILRKCDEDNMSMRSGISKTSNVTAISSLAKKTKDGKKALKPKSFKPKE